MLAFILGILTATSPAPATSGSAQQLLDTDRALAAKSLKIGFAPAYASAMGNDPRKLDPGSQPTFGSQAILAQMSRYPKGDSFTWTPREAVVAKSGELGYTWGQWSDTYRDKNGKIKHAYGKYLDVWRRGADAKWRWVVDMGNDNPKP